jgi:hypothetical protein
MAEIKRTVTVYDQNTQEKTVIENVVANTLGELKEILRAKHINLTDMDIREGISRVDLKSDSAVLPHDTPYRGSTTNDLMILLTKTNKKVSSGAGRAEAVQFIKDNNLQEEVRNTFKKNWTNVSTAELVAFVEKKGKKPCEKPCEKPEAPKEECNCGSALVEAFKTLVDILYGNDYLDSDEKADVLRALKSEPKASAGKEDKGFSDDEIYNALRDM